MVANKSSTELENKTLFGGKCHCGDLAIIIDWVASYGPYLKNEPEEKHFLQAAAPSARKKVIVGM